MLLYPSLSIKEHFSRIFIDLVWNLYWSDRQIHPSATISCTGEFIKKIFNEFIKENPYLPLIMRKHSIRLHVSDTTVDKVKNRFPAAVSNS